MICFFGKEKFVLLALPFAYIYISIYIYFYIYYFWEEILNVWNVCYIRNIHV